MRVLVLGATGLLGSAVFHVLSEKKDWLVFGTLRTEESKRFFAPGLIRNMFVCVDVLDQAELIKLFNQTKPDVVINCVSLAKSLLSAESLHVHPENFGVLSILSIFNVSLF